MDISLDPAWISTASIELPSADYSGLAESQDKVDTSIRLVPKQVENITIKATVVIFVAKVCELIKLYRELFLPAHILCQMWIKIIIFMKCLTE